MYYWMKGEDEWQVVKVGAEDQLAFLDKFGDKVLFEAENLQGILRQFDEMGMSIVDYKAA